MMQNEEKIVREFRHILLWPLQLRRLASTSGFKHPWEALQASPGPWTHVKDNLLVDDETCATGYREFVYFLPYVQRFRYGFGEADAKTPSSLTVFRRDDITKARVHLRKDAPATIASSRPRSEEFAILSVAYRAGVCVPEPIGFCSDPDVIGAPFALIGLVEGVGLGPRIVKDQTLGGDRTRLAERLGRELAKIHAVRPPREDLAFLGQPDLVGARTIEPAGLAVAVAPVADLARDELGVGPANLDLYFAKRAVEVLIGAAISERVARLYLLVDSLEPLADVVVAFEKPAAGVA